MSEALYDVSGLPIGGVRFWTPAEMQRRNWIKQSIVNTIERTLLDMNQMWRVLEVETPLMMPMGYMNAAYDENDVFILQNAPGGGDQDNRWALRAETTDGTYRIARHLLRSTSMKPPLCVYQSGKSFRRETSDGATAAKLRFNEFNQLEFQCIFGESTAAPIAETLRTVLVSHVGRLLGRQTRLVTSDRLPSYATETIDIEAWDDTVEDWREVASTSRRTDFPDVPDLKFKCLVVEIALGLDRLVALST